MTVPTISLTDRLSLFPALLSVGFTLVYKLLTAPFRGSDGAETYGREVSNAVTRTLADKLSIPQLQFIQGTSTDAYNNWVRSQSLPQATDILDEGAKLHWIGNTTSPKVLFHIHGGGYILPLSVGQLQLLNHLRTSVEKKTNIPLSVAILEYTLSPHAPYPVQFRQAVMALNHLIKRGTSPSDIVLSGDSAGAHIGLCLISHILHPHPHVPHSISPTSPLAGFLLISPRVTNDTTAPSFAQNSERDILNAKTFRRWIAGFKVNSVLAEPDGVQKDGFWTEARKAPQGWWEGLPVVVPRAFISAGGHECFRDDILSFTESWKQCQGIHVVSFLEEKGVHDSPVIDIGAGRPPTQLVLAIEKWLADSVSPSRSSSMFSPVRT